jgi:hypothetical protein
VFKNAGEVTHPVPVAIGKTPRIDLIDDSSLPPHIVVGRIGDGGLIPIHD